MPSTAYSSPDAKVPAARQPTIVNAMHDANEARLIASLMPRQCLWMKSEIENPDPPDGMCVPGQGAKRMRMPHPGVRVSAAARCRLGAGAGETRKRLSKMPPRSPGTPVEGVMLGLPLPAL